MTCSQCGVENVRGVYVNGLCLLCYGFSANAEMRYEITRLRGEVSRARADGFVAGRDAAARVCEERSTRGWWRDNAVSDWPGDAAAAATAHALASLIHALPVPGDPATEPATPEEPTP